MKMHLCTAFFLILALISPSLACNFLKAISCGLKIGNIGGMSNSTFDNLSNGNILQRIESRRKICDVMVECGETLAECKESSESKNMTEKQKRGLEALSAGCPILTRMYKDDFVDCAFVLEKNVEKSECEYKLESESDEGSNQARFEAMFDQCIYKIVRNECTEDQMRIYNIYRGTVIEFLAKYGELDSKEKLIKNILL